MRARLTKQKYAAVAFVVWIAAIIAAGIRIEAYSHAPGAAGESPVQWPAGARLQLDPTRPTLIMFVHPHCPCSRASVDDLERLMADCRGKAAAHVLFIEPPGESVEWLKTDLWRWASAIPGVEVHGDLNGEETRRFDGQTSGDVVLYDPSGRLLFHGGITASRGHSGDNPGQSAITALIDGQRSAPISTPVFGCPLFDPACPAGEAPCRK